MTRVLVCDGEQRSALAVVRSLGRAGHEVYVCNHRATGLAFGSRYAMGTARVPDAFTEADAYVGAVGALVQRWGIGIVIPVTDQSTAPLLAGIARLRGARIPGPDAATYARAADKSVVLAEAAALGIATPRQVELGTSGDVARVAEAGLRFPVVIKSTVSVRGGTRHAAVYAADAGELVQALRAEPADAYPVLVQERIVGPGTGVFLLLWNGETLAAFAHRRIREMPPSGGASVCCESIAADPNLVELSRSLLARLGWNGVAMVEFKRDADTGTPYLMEVNGRFWGSLQLAIDAGVDFPALLVSAAEGGHAKVATYRTGVRVRWWWGDLDHLIARFRATPAALHMPPNTPGRLQALTEFLAWHSNQRWEELRLDDPWPFVRASVDWVVWRVRGRLRRIAAGLRAVARAVYRFPERRLHGRRQRSIVRRMARWPRPGSVLFLCYGNICRSPYAEVIARKRLPAATRVGSAGFFGPDRSSPSEAIAVAAERGVDLSPHRSRQAGPNRVWSADLIVVMEAQQRRRLMERYPTIGDRVVLLGDLDPEPIARRDVLDPYGQPLAAFRSCFDRIERCVGVLASPWCGGPSGVRA